MGHRCRGAFCEVSKVSGYCFRGELDGAVPCADIDRKAISPSDFADLAALERRILAFQDRYYQTATPFDWRYRRTDLNAFLK